MSTSALPVTQKQSAPSSEAAAAADGDGTPLRVVQKVPPLIGSSTDSVTPTSDVAGTRSTSCGGTHGSRAAEKRCNSEWLMDAFDQSGVPDELFTVWAAEEAKLLSSPQLRCGAMPAGGTGSPTAFPDTARRVCLGCMDVLNREYRLPPEAWFGATTLLDSYVHRVGGSVPVEDLPLLCTALVRMQCKEARTGREADWSRTSLMVAQSLAAAGYAQALQRAVPANEHDLTLVELGLLRPNLEKWTSAYFKRLMVFARALDSRRAVAAWYSAMEQAPAPLVGALRRRPLRAVPTPTFLEFFGAVTGCSADTLQGDCHLARCMMLRTGTLRTAEI